MTMTVSNIPPAEYNRQDHAHSCDRYYVKMGTPGSYSPKKMRT